MSINTHTLVIRWEVTSTDGKRKFPCTTFGTYKDANTYYNSILLDRTTVSLWAVNPHHKRTLYKRGDSR